MIFVYIIFWTSAFVVGWGMVGYRLSLKILKKIFKNKKLNKDYKQHPTVSVMIVAHNEEKVILNKLENVINNDYPKDKIDYVIASDWSTDGTNKIVEDFISKHPQIKMRLYCSKEHKGKTNAQNEAQKSTTAEILVMTDANAMFEQNAISELIAAFTDEDIAYVCGRLKYVNDEENKTAFSESFYWEGDLEQREIESNIYTITAGNGAIYACRNELYHDFKPIKCHDGVMPPYYAGLGYRSVYNPEAVAYEKAGEENQDEFKRKVRMSRTILDVFSEGIHNLTNSKNGWFTYFYFGHRFCRYLLWLAHILLLISSFVLSFTKNFYKVIFFFQIFFFGIAAVDLKMKLQNKILRLIGYYSMTIFAQLKGAYNQISGKSRATWDSVESTR